MSYLRNVGHALSCLLNALFGGEQDQSLSARVGVSKVWLAAKLRQWSKHFDNSASKRKRSK